MRSSSVAIPGEDRVALLRRGVVVLEAERVRGRMRVAVTGADDARVEQLVAARLGDEVDVEVVGDLPRYLVPHRCVGHMEREPGRLQLRYVLSGDEHVDDIVVAEDVETVAVFATLCVSAHGERGPFCEVPFHVYLERPLRERAVVDGVTGKVVPYKNVYARLGA